MNKYICVHGHFYQPPRENPWLEAVELQDSAHPYHDWNERITAECYAPNAHSRRMDGDNRIESIVNNYSRISFNFGPSVLSWMREKAPDVLAAIQEADKESQRRFSGHGSAIAQCYNHIIMPLANARDKQTQVAWGIQDFESRFGRAPEGMWLPECGVDLDSLEALAQFGIQFTILSPFQASRVRPLGAAEWQDVNGGKLDPTMPYRVRLPSGRSIAIFFYDAPVAQSVAFDRLLTDGGRLAERLVGAFKPDGTQDQLVHIATDGESYGHHFRHGDMALAYALKTITSNSEVRLTVYGEFLESHPPTHEVELHQPSAWSCSHGVDRWRRDCGCNSGGHDGWNQAWREPLRTALNWLRDQLAGRYETRAGALFKDPWTAREDYINVILDRSPENIRGFFARHATRELNDEEQITALRMLEIQRHALLMYTSCGWFFDELSGLETVQVIQYAARAVQLAREVWKEDLESEFVEMLALAKGNIPDHANGRAVYEKFVKPAIVTRDTVGAHYAVSSIFESYPTDARLYAFSFHQEARQIFTSGAARLAIGRARVTFEITRASDILTYGVLYMGSHNLNCWVHLNGQAAEDGHLIEASRAAFEHGEFSEIVRLMDRHFGQTQYSLKSLFHDEQRKLINQILAATREEIDSTYKLITDRHAPLLRVLADLNAPALRGLTIAVEIVLNSEIRAQFESDRLDPERVRSLLAECRAMKVSLEREVLCYACKAHFDRLSEGLLAAPVDVEILKNFIEAAKLLPELPFEPNLWKPQNVYYEISCGVRPELSLRAAQGDEAAKLWESLFAELGKALGFSANLKFDQTPPASPDPIKLTEATVASAG
jgi:alpha-amylase/alpha-mannosidase (GH57 family)